MYLCKMIKHEIKRRVKDISGALCRRYRSRKLAYKIRRDSNSPNGSSRPLLKKLSELAFADAYIQYGFAFATKRVRHNLTWHWLNVISDIASDIESSVMKELDDVREEQKELDAILNEYSRADAKKTYIFLGNLVSQIIDLEKTLEQQLEDLKEDDQAKDAIKASLQHYSSLFKSFVFADEKIRNIYVGAQLAARNSKKIHQAHKNLMAAADSLENPVNWKCRKCPSLGQALKNAKEEFCRWPEHPVAHSCLVTFDSNESFGWSKTNSELLQSYKYREEIVLDARKAMSDFQKEGCEDIYGYIYYFCADDYRIPKFPKALKTIYENGLDESEKPEPLKILVQEHMRKQYPNMRVRKLNRIIMPFLSQLPPLSKERKICRKYLGSDALTYLTRVNELTRNLSEDRQK